MKIKHINAKSVAKIFGLTNAVFGGIIGLFFFAASFFTSSEDVSGINGLIFGIGAPITLALFYGVIGFLMGYVSVWLYNFVAKKIGGIEIETE